jgi:hypothetical protein
VQRNKTWTLGTKEETRNEYKILAGKYLHKYACERRNKT